VAAARSSIALLAGIPAVNFAPIPRSGDSHSMPSEIKPWGSYHVLETRPGYQVKRITVRPGAKASLQSHKHRSEHWTVVNGVGRATVGDTVTTLERGQSVNIPLGAKHRIENSHTELLEFIEVQFGDYLGEDDIVRHEDMYNRA
jgi:mannose-6-phosphate isomerase